MKVDPQKACRFEFLDALRGVAAICVGLLHAALIFELSLKPIHANLAVDFFFCLSGFVMGHTYDRRLASGLSLRKFIALRLIRLYPMIFISIVIGSVLLVGKVVLVPTFLASHALILTIGGLVLIPLGLLFDMAAYPVNNPIWSIFFELFISVVYGKWWLRIPLKRSVHVLSWLAVALAVVVYVAEGIDSIGFGSLRNFLFGFLRVAYPFLAGLILNRVRSKSPDDGLVPPMLTVAALLAVLLNPSFRGSIAYEVVCLLGVMPLLVALGSRTELHSTKLRKFADWLGAVSFPFYLVHSPLLRLGREISLRCAACNGHETAVVAASLLSSLLLSDVLLRVYDIPVRRRLTDWMQRRQLAREQWSVPASADPVALT